MLIINYQLLDDSLILSDFVQADAEDVAEDSFTGEESVAGLLDVVGVRIVIDVVGNLVDAGQGMENLHVGLGQT